MKLLFLFFLLLSSILNAENQKPSVKVAAPSVILINAKTGAVLYEKNAHLRRFPASITKIATTYYCLEKIGVQRLDEFVMAPRECLLAVPANVRSDPSCPSYRLEDRGTRMWIQNGEELTYRWLLHGAMLPSGNDACNVIAHYTSGSIPQFMDELNLFLKKKGIESTHFTNPHGLHDAKHMTTAYDMAMIAKMAMEHPTFREIVGKAEFIRPKTNRQPPYRLSQHNLLVVKGPYYYAKATGIKTGGTFLAKNNLVAAAEDGNRSLIAVFMGCEKLRQNFRDAVTLFEAFFAEEKVERTFFAKGCDVFSQEIKGGKAHLRAALAQDLSLSYYPSEEPEVKALLTWDDVQMPVSQGARVGEVRLVTPSQEIIRAAPILALEDVTPTLFYSLKTHLACARVYYLAALFLLALVGGVVFVFKKNN